MIWILAVAAETAKLVTVASGGANAKALYPLDPKSRANKEEGEAACKEGEGRQARLGGRQVRDILPSNEGSLRVFR